MLVVVWALLMVCALPAQIRDFICIVRPVYSEKTLSMKESLSGQVARAGYQNLSEFIKKGGNEIFGSGFVLNAPDGTVVVITNHHVVLDAEFAILQFEAADGTITEYKNCPVVAIDDELDLAMIRLPDDFPKKRGLTLSSTAVRDGADVWSAGYPGLRGDPMWQLGKGTITNAAARISRLVDPRVTTLLQHSAPVDSGNSGGPLLVENRQGTAGYEVVGVNTWKVFIRQATNFATPAQALLSFMQRALATTAGASSEDLLLRRAASFAEVTAIRNTDDRNERIRKMSRYLSLSYVHDHAPEALLNVLSSAPSVVRSEVLETISGSAILAGLRLASAWQFDVGLQSLGNEIKLEKPTETPAVAQDGQIAVSFPVQGATSVSLVWVKEKAFWQIMSASFIDAPPEATAADSNNRRGRDAEKKGEDTSAFTIEKPCDLYVYIERGFDSEIPSWGGGFFGYLNDFFMLGTIFSLYETTYLGSGDIWPYNLTERKTNVLEMGGSLRAQIPFVLNWLAIVPYLEGRAGLSLPTSDSLEAPVGFYHAWGAGIKIFFGKTYKLFVSPAWLRYTGPKYQEKDSFVLSAGIGF